MEYRVNFIRSYHQRSLTVIEHEYTRCHLVTNPIFIMQDSSIRVLQSWPDIGSCHCIRSARKVGPQGCPLASCNDDPTQWRHRSHPMPDLKNIDSNGCIPDIEGMVEAGCRLRPSHAIPGTSPKREDTRQSFVPPLPTPISTEAARHQ